MLGIFRALPNGGGRIEPVDKKMLGKALAIPPGASGDAQDGDLVAVETSRAPRLGLPTGRVVEKLGSLKSEKRGLLIAIHAHGIPHGVPARDARRGGSRQAGDDGAPRGLARRCRWSPSIRPTPRITTTPCTPSPTRPPTTKAASSLTVAIADVAHYVTPGSALDREALERGNSVYFPDRVVPMLPERISNDLCSLRPQRGPRRRSPCAW